MMQVRLGRCRRADPFAVATVAAFAFLVASAAGCSGEEESATTKLLLDSGRAPASSHAGSGGAPPSVSTSATGGAGSSAEVANTCGDEVAATGCVDGGAPPPSDARVTPVCDSSLFGGPCDEATTCACCEYGFTCVSSYCECDSVSTCQGVGCVDGAALP